jgi:hypothetical protein
MENLHPESDDYEKPNPDESYGEETSEINYTESSSDIWPESSQGTYFEVRDREDMPDPPED